MAQRLKQWYVLQHEDQPDIWVDQMTLRGWHDPIIRAGVLAMFRENEVPEQWRMVRRTEEILDE